MKVRNLVPDVYYKESRDFAAIGRLLEIVFNYMKSVADCVEVNPDEEYNDGLLVDLVTNTLGFEARHKYITKDLIYITSGFIELIRKKGTIEAIKEAIQLLLSSQKIEKIIDCKPTESDPYELDIQIPGILTDVVLLEDLFDYILPAGVTYRFTKIEAKLPDAITNIYNYDSAIPKLHSDIELGSVMIENSEDDNLTPTDLIGTIGTEVIVSNDNANSKKVIKSIKPITEYELINEKPEDWDLSYKNYYKYNEEQAAYVKNYAKTWKENTYYLKEE